MRQTPPLGLLLFFLFPASTTLLTPFWPLMHHFSQLAIGLTLESGQENRAKLALRARAGLVAGSCPAA